MSDFNLDWTAIGADGAITLDSGGRSVGVTVTTTTNAEGKSFGYTGLEDGVLTAGGVHEPVSADVTFDTPVSNLTFELLDVDSLPGAWDDKVTVLAHDPDGNLLPVTFSNTSGHHAVSGNTVEAEGNASPGVEGYGAPDSVTVSVDGPVASLSIILDNGADAASSGTVRIGDLSFDAYHGDETDTDADHSGGDAGDAGMVDSGSGHAGTEDGGEPDHSDGDGGAAAAVPAGSGGPASGGGGSASGSGGGGGSLDYIVEGTAGNDVIDYDYTGDPEGDRVDHNDNAAGNNDDVIEAYGGDDRIRAGDGNDTVYAGDGDDYASGGKGDDTLFLGDGDDKGSGDDGDDTIYAGAGDDLLYGGKGDDTLWGGAGNDRLRGGSGDDTLNTCGDGEADKADGGKDADTFHAGAGDVVNGGHSGHDFDTLMVEGPITVTLDGGGVYNLNVGDTLDFGSGANVSGTVTGPGLSAPVRFREIERIEATNTCPVPCFTNGTLIATPYGEVPIETLEVGDRVITRDNGVQRIRWIGERVVGGDELGRMPSLRPILIEAGALGNGLPERDLLVSPNHRMLVTGQADLLYGEAEVLVAAKHLTHLPGVRQVDVENVTYFHILFDRHEIVLSNGTWSESFRPGDVGMDALEDDQRREILALFPELAQETARVIDFPAARRILKRHEAEALG